MQGNLAGIDSSLAPDLGTFDMARFLAGLEPSRSIAARHTVGMLDPLARVDARDRVADLIKKGRTLQQVMDSNPVLDYDARYGAKTGLWTTDAFITAVFSDLSKKKN